VFREPLARDYFAALREEIAMYGKLGYQFSSLYVGGGTPTVLMDELIEMLHMVQERFPITEISVETNPNHLTDEKLRSLKDAGVNRLSVGVQSFDDQLLKAMERYHKYGSRKEIAERLQATQGMFDTLNVDMMFNFPMQTMAILEQDLGVIRDLKADQVTYYPLMVSTSTQGAVKRKLGEMEPGREKKFYQKIVELLTPDYHPSTAWCFSRQATMIDEYVVNYEEYGGLGSGSFGYLGGNVYANTFSIEEYIERIRAGRLPLAAKREFSLKERLRYDFLMKLFGMQLDLEYLRNKWRRPVNWYLWPEIFFFRTIGGLKREGSVLTLTPKGQYYWVIMMREFFVAVNNFRDYCREDLQDKKH
jgi:coproporphyrinogen III oxidase-like Fe-S oxidoreductase